MKSHSKQSSQMIGAIDSNNLVLDVIEKHAEIVSEIITARVKKKWTQKDLAEKCSLKQSAIARIEACSNTPNLATVLKIITVLDLNLAVCDAEKVFDKGDFIEHEAKLIIDNYKFRTSFTNTFVPINSGYTAKEKYKPAMKSYSSKQSPLTA